MATDLRLQVLLQALDKASAPLKHIDGASKGAAKALRDTRDSLKKLDELQAQVGDFRRLKQGTRDNETELGKLQARIGELSSSIRANDGDVAKHTAELKRATRAAAALKAKHQQQTEQLQALRGRLAEAGINTRQLSEAERRLRTDTAAATASLETQKEALKQQAIHAQRLANIERAGAANRATRAAVASQFMGTAAAVAGVGYVFGRVVGAGNEFDYQLQMIGNTANMTAAQVATLRERIMAASRDTGQSASTVEQAVGFLVAAGMDTDAAAASIRTIGRTATASGAEINDIAQASYTLQDAMAIRPEGLQQALDMLSQAGKDGNIELRDMAKVLPQFGSAFQAMKMQGPGAVATLGAALEIARKGAPSADEAATNMANFFQKVMSPDTLKKAKAGFGVDLYKIISDAQQAGRNPFEAAMQSVIKMTGGDMKKVGELFQDAQVQHFVLPMMQHWEEYKHIRDDALSAKGVTDRDFAKITQTAKQKFTDMVNAADRVGKSISHALGGSLGNVAEALVPVLNRLADFIDKNPRLVSGIVITSGALIGLRLAFLGVRWAASLLGAPALLTRLGAVRDAIAGVAQGGMFARLRAGASTAFPMLTRGASLARAGLLAVTGASMPVVAAVAAVAVVALLVWKYWKPIKAFIGGIWDGIVENVAPLGGMFAEAFAPLKPAWDAIKSVFGMLFAQSDTSAKSLSNIAEVGRVVGKVLSFSFTAVAAIAAVAVQGIVWVFKGLGEFIGYVAFRTVDFFTKAWDNVKTYFGGLWDVVAGIFTLNGDRIAKGWSAMWSGMWGLVDTVTASIRQTFSDAFDWILGKIDWIVKKWQALKGALHMGSDGEPQPAGAPRNWAFDDGAAPPPRIAIDTRKPLRAASAGVVNQQQYHINVTQQPGENSRDFAKRVREEMAAHERAKAAKRRSDLHDHE